MQNPPNYTPTLQYMLDFKQLTLSEYNHTLADYSLNGIIQGIIRARMPLEDKLARILANKHLPNHMKAQWAKKIVESGADVTTRNHVTLRWAAEHGDLELVKMAVERGSDIHCLKDEPLSRASLQGHTHVVEYLLDKGADLHVKDDVALRLAASCGHSDVVALLLNKGTTVTVRHNEPMRKAFDGGHFGVLKLLLSQKGKDILNDAQSEEDWQIFAIAWQYAKLEQDEAVQALLEEYDYRPTVKSRTRMMA